MTHVGLVISSSCDAKLSLTGRFRSPRESLDCLSVTKKPAGCFSRNNAVQNRKRARCHSHQRFTCADSSQKAKRHYRARFAFFVVFLFRPVFGSVSNERVDVEVHSRQTGITTPD